MKKIFLYFIASLSFLAGFNIFADAVTKVTISGNPVTVTKENNYYILNGSTTYTTTSDYYYITLDGKDQVCYKEIQSTFAGINPVDLSLKIGNDLVSVHCYSYSNEYFNNAS